MKVLSDKYNEATGTIGDLTFAMNGNSIVVKKKANPSNPSTTRQTVVRSALALANVTWKTMAQDKRDLWELHAATLKSKDSLGVVKKVSGWSAFSGAFVLITQAGQSTAQLLDGQGLKDGYLPSSGYVMIQSTGVLSIRNESGEPRIMATYISDPIEPTINNNGAGYHFKKAESLPDGAEFAFEITEYAFKKIFCKFQTFDLQGNISKPTLQDLIIGAVTEKADPTKHKGKDN